MSKTLAGMYAALMTGFDDTGAFCPERQRSLTRYVMGQGLRGLYVGGSSGESGLLESAALLEQQAVVAEAAAGADHRLIAHVGMPSLADSIRLAQNAAELGYDALSALPPHAYPFTDEEVVGYYDGLCRATDLPLIVYDIPMRTGRPMGLDQLQRLFDLPNVIGIKFTSMDLFKLSLLRRQRPDRLYFFGCDEVFTAAAALGVDGGIGSTYNLLGRLYVALFDAVARQDLVQARELQTISQDFVEILGATGVVPGTKAALRLIGVECGPTRAPMATRVADADDLLRPFLDRPDVRGWLAL